MIRLDPVCEGCGKALTIRGYDDGINIDKPLDMMNESYRLIGTIVIKGQVAHIKAFKGSWTSADRRQLKGKLIGMGVTEAVFRRGDRTIRVFK